MKEPLEGSRTARLRKKVTWNKYDYVTGYDRSFERSLYQFLGFRFKEVLLRSVKYNGEWQDTNVKPMRKPILMAVEEFRLAMRDDLRYYGIVSNSKEFILNMSEAI